jgi:hydroxymethylpyrimidine/phosphomethylpyrimidine kinase
MTAIVGITVQTPHGVTGRQDIAPHLIAAQIAAVIEDIGVDAVKVGATWSRSAVEAIAAALQDLCVPIVLDPVLITAAQSILADPEIASCVTELLFPLATVVTPNLREAQILAGEPEITNPRVLAETLVESGASAVIVTGGGSQSRSDAFYDGQSHFDIAGEWHDTMALHGSGCAHSAALTAYLAFGVPLANAARLARDVAANAVRRGWTVGGGLGPVDVIDIGSRIPEIAVS